MTEQIAVGVMCTESGKNSAHLMYQTTLEEAAFFADTYPDKIYFLVTTDVDSEEKLKSAEELLREIIYAQHHGWSVRKTYGEWERQTERLLERID